MCRNFDDLIARTAALLGRSDMAQWVLFRLDGGIDHILVDEAQDTSPRQWQVIEGLTAEFTAADAAAAGGRRRTLFVVGDPKQSIYSFQGADMAEFDTFYKQLIAAVPLKNVTSRFAMERLKATTAYPLHSSVFRDRTAPEE